MTQKTQTKPQLLHMYHHKTNYQRKKLNHHIYHHNHLTINQQYVLNPKLTPQTLKPSKARSAPANSSVVTAGLLALNAQLGVPAGGGDPAGAELLIGHA